MWLQLCSLIAGSHSVSISMRFLCFFPPTLTNEQSCQKPIAQDLASSTLRVSHKYKTTFTAAREITTQHTKTLNTQLLSTEKESWVINAIS